MKLTFYELSRPFVTVAIRLFCSYEIRNRNQNLPNGPLIIASNHLSWFDIPLIGLAIPKKHIAFMAKKEYFHSPFHRFLIDLYGSFTVARGTVDRTALKLADKALAEGRPLGIFPEGTRSKTLQLQKGHLGTAFIALRRNAYILPIGIWGTEKIRLKCSKITNIFYRPKVVVNVGEPFRLPEVKGNPSRQDLVRATDIIMRRIAELLPEEYRGVYRDNADQKG